MRIDKNCYQLPNGKVIDEFYRMIRTDYVMVIAIDNIQNIVMEQQYRWGNDKIVYNLPAGWIDKDEKPAETALRELREETGYSGTKPKLLGIIDAQPGFSPLKAYIFKVIIDQWSEPKNPDKTEEIKTLKLPLKKVYQMIKNGQITDMSTIAALGLYREYISK